MTSALRARAVVEAEATDGMTRLATLRSDPPLTLRPAGGALYLAASAAGPLGGDQVDLDVSVGAGASLEVRSVAATVVLPGPTGLPSSAAVNAVVGDAGVLRFLPEPTVLAAGCDHRATALVMLDAGATLVWREELVLGRHDEPGGSVLQRLRIDRGGRPLLCTEHALGPRWPGSTGPAGTGGHRAVGTLVVVGPAAQRGFSERFGSGNEPNRAENACARLAVDAVVVCAVAPTASALRRCLDAALAYAT